MLTLGFVVSLLTCIDLYWIVLIEWNHWSILHMMQQVYIQTYLKTIGTHTNTTTTCYPEIILKLHHPSCQASKYFQTNSQLLRWFPTPEVIPKFTSHNSLSTIQTSKSKHTPKEKEEEEEGGGAGGDEADIKNLTTLTDKWGKTLWKRHHFWGPSPTYPIGWSLTPHWSRRTAAVFFFFGSALSA